MEEGDKQEPGFVDRLKQTSAWGALGAAAMGVAVTGINFHKGHSTFESLGAGLAQFGYTATAGTFLIPTYEVVAAYCRDKAGTGHLVAPVLVPFSLNVMANAATHWSAGTPELAGSVAAASTASFFALSGLHAFRQPRVKALTSNVSDSVTEVMGKFFKG